MQCMQQLFQMKKKPRSSVSQKPVITRQLKAYRLVSDVQTMTHLTYPTVCSPMIFTHLYCSHRPCCKHFTQELINSSFFKTTENLPSSIRRQESGILRGCSQSSSIGDCCDETPGVTDPLLTGTQCWTHLGPFNQSLSSHTLLHSGACPSRKHYTSGGSQI